MTSKEARQSIFHFLNYHMNLSYSDTQMSELKVKMIQLNYYLNNLNETPLLPYNEMINTNLSQFTLTFITLIM